MALPATDSFTDTNGVQLEDHNASWTVLTNDFDIQNNMVEVDGAEAEGAIAYWNADAFNNDQYAELDYSAEAVSYQYMGVSVRINAEADGYDFSSCGLDSAMGRFDNGVWTRLGSAGSSLVVGERMRLEAEGTTITPFVDGDEFSPPGAVTDATYSSGSAGLSGYALSPYGTLGDNWEGGNLGGGGVISEIATVSWANVGQFAGVAEASIAQVAGVVAN